MEESGSTKAKPPDIPKTSSFRLELPCCCNSTWAAVDVPVSSAPIPSHSSLGTSSWLGTCTVADGTAKFSFWADRLPGGVGNRARQILEWAHGKWESPLVAAAGALEILKALWKAHCWAQVSCKPFPAQSSTSPHGRSECLSPLPLSPAPTAGSEPQVRSRAGSSSSPWNPHSTGTNPWKGGQGELPEHYTARITAPKVIFTYSQRN